MRKHKYQPSTDALALRVRNVGEKYDLSDYAVRRIADAASAWIELPVGRRIDVAAFNAYVESCKKQAQE